VALYTRGIDANRFDGLSDDDVIDHVLEDLSAVHDRDLEFLKKNLREGIVKRWANDPYTLGAFAMFTPYQGNFLNCCYSFFHQF
jgi:L-amino-acid oxidase